MPGNPLLDAALDYAARGLRVVVLHQVKDGVCSCNGKSCTNSAGKHPRLPKWQENATSDAAELRNLWAKWPHANVGVLAGSTSGVVGVDIDSADGEALLVDLCGGRDTPTWEMVTGKGRRLIFGIPDGVPEPRTRAYKDAAGRESVRLQGGASGAQFVMPPSMHPSGRRYQWVEGRSPADLEPALMPDWLVIETTRPDSAAVVDAGAASLESPGADFNRNGRWFADCLEPAGFKQAGKRGEVFDFTRPGKDGGVSVTVGHYRAKDGTPALYCFSGSIPELTAGKCYDLFGAFTRLHCKGDYALAAKALAAKGYGSPRGPVRASAPARIAVPATPADAWGGPPIPLDAGDDSPAPFPLDVFPAALEDLLASTAESVGCPPDYAAAHALGIAAGVLGGLFDLQVKRGYVAPTNLFVCVVAPPGGGKSPGVAPILAPLYEEQARRARDGEKAPCYVQDVTVEKLATFLHEHPRGFPMVWDEMAGWISSFDQYKAKGSGADRAHYLSIWDGRPLKVDRKASDAPPLFVRFPRLSVVGGVQPEVLESLRSGPSDGLLDRLLFAAPADRGMHVETFAETDDRLQDRWAEVLKSWWGQSQHHAVGGTPRPKLIDLLEDARPVWTAWTQRIAKGAESPDAPPYYRAMAAKIAGYVGRLALVLHLLREGYGDTAGRGVGADDLTRAVKLGQYFLSHGDRVRRAGGRDVTVSRAKAVLRWAAGLKEPAFTRGEAWDSLRRNGLFAEPGDLSEPLRRLALHRAVRWVEDGDRRGSGRYEVHPAVAAGAV